MRRGRMNTESKGTSFMPFFAMCERVRHDTILYFAIGVGFLHRSPYHYSVTFMDLD